MTSRWLRWSRSQQDEPHTRALPSELTEVFMDMDDRLGIAQAAVLAATALSPQSSVAREWEPIREACYAASAAYLEVASGADGAASPGQPSPRSFASVQRHLSEARRGLDTFYERHRRTLDGAAAAAAAASSNADAALAEAHRAQQRLVSTDEQWMGYPSVQLAHDRLETTRHELQLARDRGDLAATRNATDRLRAAITELLEALETAPQRVEQARRTVASVRTRLDAARTRADDIGPNLSALLREFHADSSADLLDNDRKSRTDIDRADALLQQAQAARMEHRPEAALDLAAQARVELGKAEHLVDAVADRLTMLRQIRADPGRRERDVRFQLRDAQRLAVERGVVEEWGTALDAQVSRIDRIVVAVRGRHPNFWRYHLALEEVSEFVATIVSRIRQRSAR